MIDIEKMLREGKSLEDIGAAVSAEMNAAQKKIDEEATAKAKEKKLKEKKEVARKAAIAALKDYFALVCPDKKVDELEMYARLTIDTMSESMSTLNKVKISVNGEPWDWLKMLADIGF